ncbi:MAG: purine-binding chemotaxis protein CheW [Anaerolineae bacterium]|nr:purine-binding chemotaxis protein CheW [Anaerolineae bacterium]
MLQAVVFKLADEVYGVDIAAIEQIIELQRITTVPHTPPYIAGLTNLRGTVLPVIDLRKRLELPVKDPTREMRIIVAQIRGARVGMIVDTVTEVLHIPEANVEPPSPLVTTIDSAYIIGIAKLSEEARSREAGPLVVLVDLEQILPDVSTV